MLSVLEARIFLQYGFQEEHKGCVITVIDPQHREMKSRLWRLIQNFSILGRQERNVRCIVNC